MALEKDAFPTHLVFDDVLENFDTVLKCLPTDDLWLTSKVYKVDTQLNELNLDLRKSQKLNITNRDLFDFLDTDLLPKINTGPVQFKLVRDELELIRYETGGYFKPHQDFVHFISNQIKTYAGILCLQGNCQGGETVLHLPDPVPIRQTKTPNGLLIVRNEVLHEGAEVLEGQKIILKFNLLATLADVKIIRVTFKDDPRCLYLDETTINRYPNSYLASALRFKPTASTIEIIDFSYDDFEVVHRFLLGDRLPLPDIRDHSSILDYFGYNFELEKTVYKHYRSIFKQSIQRMDRFLDRDHEDTLLVSASTEEYVQFKAYFATNPNLLTVQWAYNETGVLFMGIEGVLVEVRAPTVKKWRGDEVLGQHRSILDVETDSDVDLVTDLLERLLQNYAGEINEFQGQQCRMCTPSPPFRAPREPVPAFLPGATQLNLALLHRVLFQRPPTPPAPTDDTPATEHHPECHYDQVQPLIDKILPFIGDDLAFSKYLMEGILYFTRLKHEEELYDKIGDHIPASGTPKPRIRPVDLHKIRAGYHKIREPALNTKLIKSEAERAVGAYTCNEAEYYEETINLGLGFLNLQKYL